MAPLLPHGHSRQPTRAALGQTFCLGIGVDTIVFRPHDSFTLILSSPRERVRPDLLELSGLMYKHCQIVGSLLAAPSHIYGLCSQIDKSRRATLPALHAQVLAHMRVITPALPPPFTSHLFVLVKVFATPTMSNHEIQYSAANGLQSGVRSMVNP